MIWASAKERGRPAKLAKSGCRNVPLPASFTYGETAAPAFLYSYVPFLLLGFVFQFIARHSKDQRYTPEFKKLVVETMLKEKLSYCETARQFEVSDDKRVAAWERIYLTEGPEGFAIERRGRSSKGRSGTLPKEVEEDLLAEVQRQRAENEYLKKLQALVMENERRRHKKRW